MTTFGEGIQVQSVPMTPNYKVLWEFSEVPNLEGTLYIAPKCTVDMVEKVLDFAAKDSSIDLPTLGKGAFGRVYDDGNLAVKEHFLAKYDCEFGLSDLRANVGMTHGLAKAGSLTLPGTGEVIKYRGPEYFCGFLPDNMESKHKPIWLMSHETGRKTNENELPPEDLRDEVFLNAVVSCGFEKDDIQFDDFARNTIAIAEKNYVKIDVMANAIFSY